MPMFSYRAVDATGNIVTGHLFAENELALEARLQNSKTELLRSKVVSNKKNSRLKRVKRKELINFCFHLEQTSKAGLPMLDALEDLRDGMENMGFRQILSSVIEAIEGGKTFSKSLEDYPEVFDEVFVNLVAVGEETGEMAEVMLRLTESLKWQDEMFAAAKSIVIYPAFVGTVVLAVLLFMMIYVVPQMVDFIQQMGQTLPLHTRALIGFSDFLVANWWWAVPMPPIFIFSILWAAKKNKNLRFKLDAMKLKIWYVGNIQKKIILSRFSSYFSLLYSSGLDVLTALKISEGITGNMVVKDAIQSVSTSVTAGKPLSTSIEETGLFPPLIIRLIGMGESTGDLDSSLSNVSYFYDREVNESIERLKAAIEPAMTVILGAILAWVMMSVLGPVYQTISGIGS